jgi:hypothetical protein
MKKLFDRMKVISSHVLSVQAAIVLSVLYVFCIPLLWVIYRSRPHRGEGWIDWDIPSETLEDMRRQ